MERAKKKNSTRSIIGEAGLEAIILQLVRVSGAHDVIASDLGIHDLSDDVPVGLYMSRAEIKRRLGHAAQLGPSPDQKKKDTKRTTRR